MKKLREEKMKGIGNKMEQEKKRRSFNTEKSNQYTYWYTNVINYTPSEVCNSDIFIKKSSDPSNKKYLNCSKTIVTYP